jgi:hypothetical protein
LLLTQYPLSSCESLSSEFCHEAVTRYVDVATHAYAESVDEVLVCGLFGLVPIKDDGGEFGADYIRVGVTFGP